MKYFRNVIPAQAGIQGTVARSLDSRLRGNDTHASGMTLIEVLIALAVLAISLTAIVRATAMDVSDTSYLRDKTLALWIANNSMTQVQLGLVNVKTNRIDMSTNMLNQDWYWTADVSHTPNQYVDKVIITVSKKRDEKPLITLTGFKEASP